MQGKCIFFFKKVQKNAHTRGTGTFSIVTWPAPGIFRGPRKPPGFWGERLAPYTPMALKHKRQCHSLYEGCQTRGVHLPVIRLDGASDDGGGRVAAYVVLGRSGDGAGDVTGVQEAGCQKERQNCEGNLRFHEW